MHLRSCHSEGRKASLSTFPKAKWGLQSFFASNYFWKHYSLRLSINKKVCIKQNAGAWRICTFLCWMKCYSMVLTNWTFAGARHLKIFKYYFEVFFFFFPQEHTPHYLQDVGQPLCKGQGSGSFTSLLSTQILSPDMSSPRTTIFTPPFILSLVSRYSLSPLALGLQGWPCPTTALPQEVEGGNGRMDSGSEEGGPGPGLQLQYEGGNVAPLCIYTMYLDR